MEHIHRMEQELEELIEKIGKISNFLKKVDEKQITIDEIQEILLVNQKEHMKSYARILKHRIQYDTLKAQKDKSCSTSENYDTVTQECFK